MPSTYDGFETSANSGEPVELYDFESAVGSFTLTDCETDLVIGGVTYRSSSITRTAPLVKAVGQPREIIVTVPVDDDLAVLLAGNGLPPESMLCIIRRTHRPLLDTSFSQLSDISRQLWRGYVNGSASAGVDLQLRIPSAIDEKFTVMLPMVVSGRSCPHLLYDAGCQVPRSASNRVLTFASTASAFTLTVSSMGGQPSTWASGGEVVRIADGARRSILAQTGNDLLLDVPFGTLSPGDQLEVWRGCQHTSAACLEFDNIVNFGGQPDMPTNNPTVPAGHGVIVQE